MPAMHRTLLSHRPLLLHYPSIRFSSTHFRRADFSAGGQGYTGSYEPGAPTVGPLSHASKSGTTRLTPSLLKEHLDKYVVGQTKAKKVTSVAIYNHYQRIRESRRLEAEEQERREKEARRMLKERERDAHPLENEYPGHVDTVDLNPPAALEEPDLGSKALDDRDHDATIIEKSNLMLLGPSGVGKTYILQTLSRILEVPFATVDCSALTQAGYIGTDIESSIERLLLASSHNISKCETGIIFFDEVDKLAKPAVMTHGRDVSGEGVQQGLLKMIEGTTVTVSGRTERNRGSERDGASGRLERGGRDPGAMQGGGAMGRAEQYTIDTTNILFVFAGAFVGLERIITNRLQSGTSLGFGASLPAPKTEKGASPQTSPLEHCTPHDLQNYGLIPELLGRIPIITSLHPLSLTQLVSILTEPKNSLVNQYTTLFATSNINLKFTTLALHAIAERALDHSHAPSSNHPKSGGGIGARGLRSIMESVLGEIMFWGPGSGIRYCLVDEAFVRGDDSSTSQFTASSPTHTTHSQKAKHSGMNNGPSGEASESKSLMPRCWSRGQGRLFEEAWEKEEAAFRAREEESRRSERGQTEGEELGSFERYRKVGSSGM